MTGSFRAAYQRNIVEARESLLEDDLVAVAVQQLRLPWEGSASKMLEELTSMTGQTHLSAKDWPKEPNALSGRLRRLAPLLRSKGVNAEKLPRTGAKRGWRLTAIGEAEGKPDLPSSPSSASTATATCTALTGAVIPNQPPVEGNDDCDNSDDQLAGFSGRQQPVLPDIDAAYEELRIRADAAGSPARRLRERKRTPLRRRKPFV
jgi:hypothetical protein